MATISGRVPADLGWTGESSKTDEPPAFFVRARGWAAVDSSVEARLEHQLSREISWREALFGWLVEFNRY